MQGYGKRILIVDDAEDLRYLTGMAFVSAGYNVYSASDGAEGLDAMKRRRYDVVLVDYHMPRLNGPQFITTARSKWPDTPIILMSSDHRFNGHEHLMDGVFAYVEKPFELPHLIQLVGCACQRESQQGTAQMPAFASLGSAP